MTLLAKESDFASMRIQFEGDEVDRFGANIHNLGRALLSSQELVNIAASHQVRQDFPLEEYTKTTIPHSRYRVFFLQGHLAETNKGSLDVLVNLINQAELRYFLTDENARAFSISVLANLFTSAAVVLGGRWQAYRSNEKDLRSAQNGLAIQMAPYLEPLARTITPRGGIGRIRFSTKDQNGNELNLEVDRRSHNNILEYAETAHPAEIDIIGEVRSIDLDTRTLVILHPVTGERFEVEVFDQLEEIESLLKQAVYIRGRIRPAISSRRTVKKKIEGVVLRPLVDHH